MNPLCISMVASWAQTNNNGEVLKYTKKIAFRSIIIFHILLQITIIPLFYSIQFTFIFFYPVLRLNIN